MRPASPNSAGFARQNLFVGAAVVMAFGCAAVQAATRLVPEEYSTIQGAIDASVTGDTVLIGPGIYRGEGNRGIEFRGRDIVVKSRYGPEETIIDCEQGDRGFFLDDYWETRAARIEGLTITHGYAGPGLPGGGAGGGVYCGISSPTIIDCRILECQAETDGGGIAVIVFDGIIDGCMISGCVAGRGGGISFVFGQAEIADCVITGNFARDGGGVCYVGPADNTFFGCTIAANLSGDAGGGIYTVHPLHLERTIVWGNCSLVDADQIWCGDADMICSDVDTLGIRPGALVDYEDCVFADPLFCGPAPCGIHTDGDWSLDAASSCLAENSPCGEQIGALGQGCCGPTPGEITTWGRLKVLFGPSR